MQKYGIIENEKLKLVDRGVLNAKPVIYEKIPTYNQESQAVFELQPEDRGDHIYVGLEVREVPQDEPREEGAIE